MKEKIVEIIVQMPGEPDRQITLDQMMKEFFPGMEFLGIEKEQPKEDSESKQENVRN